MNIQWILRQIHDRIICRGHNVLYQKIFSSYEGTNNTYASQRVNIIHMIKQSILIWVLPFTADNVCAENTTLESYIHLS